jgi:hypothetical protein
VQASSAPVAVLRAEPRRATMMIVVMLGSIALSAFLDFIMVTQRAPPWALVLPAALLALSIGGIAWARRVNANLMLEIGQDGITYRAASGKVVTVPYREIDRVEVLGAPTMHVATVAAGVAGGAIGGMAGRTVARAAGKIDRATSTVVPVRLKLWTSSGGRAVVVPTDNLRHAESAGILPLLVARGVPEQAITVKMTRKATLRT